jgi:hypothetical protein
MLIVGPKPSKEEQEAAIKDILAMSDEEFRRQICEQSLILGDILRLIDSRLAVLEDRHG